MRHLREKTQECMLTSPCIPVVSHFAADSLSPRRQGGRETHQKVKFNSSKNIKLFFFKQTQSPWTGDSSNYCSRGRVNSVGTGLSARLNIVLEEIYVWRGEKGPPFTLKFRVWIYSKGGCLRWKKPSWVWPLAWNHLNSETLLRRTCALSHFPLLNPEVWCKSICAY